MAFRQFFSGVKKYFDDRRIEKQIAMFEDESVSKWLLTWIRHPYNHWAMAATDLMDLYRLIIDKKPNCIVEFGTATGFSTVVMAYALKRIGRGRIISLEQDIDMHEYAKKMSPPELNAYIDYRLSPITVSELERNKFMCYKNDFETPIDFAVIDGPVGFVIDSPSKGKFFNFYAAKRVAKLHSLSTAEQKIFSDNMKVFGKNHALDNLDISQLDELGFLHSNNEVTNQIARYGALYQVFANSADSMTVIVDGSFSDDWNDLIERRNYRKERFGVKSHLLQKERVGI